MKKLILINTFFTIILFFNCAKTKYYTKDLSFNVRMTKFTENDGYILKKRFEVSHTRQHFFWGLLIAYSKDLESILEDELNIINKSNIAIGNLNIIETYTFIDSLLDFALWGFYRPYTVKIEGELYEKISNSANELNNDRIDLNTSNKGAKK
jgi:hypothetical protein